MPIDISTTLATFQAVAGVAKAAGKIDLYQQVIELQQALLATIGENAKLTVENAGLTRDLIAARAELDTLKAESARRATMHFENAMYWQKEGDETTDGPFCARCYDSEAKVVRMTDRKNGFICCVACKYCVPTGGFPRPSPRVIFR